MRKIKIAIIHEWFVDYSGSERVVEQMLNCYPGADLFSLVDFLPSNERGFIGGRNVRTSFIQKLPFARKCFRSYFPLFPLAVEQFDLSQYDLIISSSHSVAKGVITGPNQIHICMCYSPMRYAWDLQYQYLRESKLNSGLKGWIAKLILHYMRIWDLRSSNGVDSFIAISKYISKRINKVYRRESTVIYPPVDILSFEFQDKKDDYYLTASRMVPYKMIPLIVEAFSKMPNRRLVVIGSGPEFRKCEALATSNIILMGWQKFDVLKDHMQRAKAFIFAAEEDFGITPLEAQACGTPVIAFKRGAAIETILGQASSDKKTGIFFESQELNSLISAVEEFELSASEIKSTACRENALRFSAEIFRDKFTKFINNILLNHGR
jgi:glycosyltransferase involved in cell wall biosynthesis